VTDLDFSVVIRTRSRAQSLADDTIDPRRKAACCRLLGTRHRRQWKLDDTVAVANGFSDVPAQ
jgi:hypothetical protein